MRKIRAAQRFLRYAGHLAFVYVIYLGMRPFCAGAARKERWREQCFRFWACNACRILGIGITLKGRAPIAPFLLVSNHLGYADICVLGALVNGRFIAKSEIATWPLLGRAVRAAGTIFVDRKEHRDLVRVNEVIEEALDKGEGIILFPEGTSSDGADVLPFRPSLLDYAAREFYPVHYATISYATPSGEPAADEAVCWWGDMPFFSHFLKLLEISRIEASVVFGSEPVTGPDRKRLASQLRHSVREGFEPVTKKEGTCQTQLS